MAKHNTKRRQVAVVGLLADQEHRVVREMGSSFDLRFLPANRRPGFPAGCHEAVLMTKFIGHDWQREAYSQFDRGEVRLCHGGISRLITLLASLRHG